VQSNIADGVMAARDRWFNGGGDQSDFDTTIEYLHLWSASAAYHVLKSAHASRGGGRGCNAPPRFDAFDVLSPSSGEIQVTFDPDEALSQFNVHWGDGTTSGWKKLNGSSGPQSESKTGVASGTYQVAVLIEDDHKHRSRNVKFKWITVVSLCGNNTIDTGETCDPPLSCPTDCDDRNPCTIDQLTGSAANCDAACSYAAITQCRDDDGCCPAGCDPAVDSDCSATPRDAGLPSADGSIADSQINDGKSSNLSDGDVAGDSSEVPKANGGSRESEQLFGGCGIAPRPGEPMFLLGLALFLALVMVRRGSNLSS
jgi:hypothetical protein